MHAHYDTYLWLDVTHLHSRRDRPCQTVAVGSGSGDVVRITGGPVARNLLKITRGRGGGGAENDQ